MTTFRLRLVLVALAAFVAFAATPLLAQRGFGGWFTPSYSGTVPYDGRFTFVRMSYPYMGRRGAPWAHDWPVGEEHFLRILTYVSNVRAHTDDSSIMTFGDPELFKFPVAYLVEPGYWLLEQDEVTALRGYLVKGGFLIVDDFPSEQWTNFELQMSRVFPDGRWVDLTPEHPIFHSFFDIDPFKILPPYQLGGQPMFRALFEDNDPAQRMYVIANYQNDLSEYWESSATGISVIPEQSNEAFKIGVNQFIYGITH
jgi:hypothetical protein